MWESPGGVGSNGYCVRDTGNPLSRICGPSMVFVFFQHARDDTLEMIFMVAWCMWYNRNMVRHGSIRQSATMVVQKARVMLVEFQVANHIIALPRMEMTNSWTLPTTPNYKMNVDGVGFTQIRGSTVKVVIRDHDGRVVTTMSMKLLQHLGLLEIEAIVMEIGVVFAWDVGIRDVVVESDSKIVVDTILGLCTLTVVSNVLVGVTHKLQDFRLV